MHPRNFHLSVYRKSSNKRRTANKRRTSNKRRTKAHQLNKRRLRITAAPRIGQTVDSDDDGEDDIDTDFRTLSTTNPEKPRLIFTFDNFDGTKHNAQCSRELCEFCEYFLLLLLCVHVVPLFEYWLNNKFLNIAST